MDGPERRGPIGGACLRRQGRLPTPLTPCLGGIALRAMPVRLASSPNGHGFAALRVEYPPNPLSYGSIKGGAAQRLKSFFESKGRKHASALFFLRRNELPARRLPTTRKSLGRMGGGLEGGRRDFLQKVPPSPSNLLYSAFTSPITEMAMRSASTTFLKRASSTLANQRLPIHMPIAIGTRKTAVKMSVPRWMRPCCQ